MTCGVTSLLSRLFVTGAIALGVAVHSSTEMSVSAASRSTAKGCPVLGDNRNDNSGMTNVGLLTPEDAVARSVAQITDAWYAAHNIVAADYIAERLAFVESLDENGDGLICVATVWGQNLNPNSHWALIEADLLSPPAIERWAFIDNHMGTSNKR